MERIRFDEGAYGVGRFCGFFHGNEVAGVFETLHMGMGSMGLKGTFISFKGLICLHF